ncbi:MAG: sugar/nucleoside kinase (ribokinase family) [Rickettsiales bacterium]|jgi:sugar/nucleoside kinase (ribokinase family)
MSKKYLVSALGNAIVDTLILVDDSFLLENSITKGSMTLINKDIADQLSNLEYQKISSGGSTCNTVATISSLGKKCLFIGKVANDKFGKIFNTDLKESNCDFHSQYSNISNSTSKSFILVSKEDGERTMMTYLGDSSKIDQIDDEDILQNSEIIYIEGYLWDKKETINSLSNFIQNASKKKITTAFTLSDSFCVSRHKNDFLNLIKNIDILFANEDEIKILTDNKEDLLNQKKYNNLFNINPNIKLIITISERGSIIVTKNSIKEVKTKPIKNLVDSTGSGDAFASGFLLGLSCDLDLEQSAKLGNLIASKIIKKLGARFDSDEINEIKTELCQFGI